MAPKSPYAKDKFATLYEVGRLINSTLNLADVLELVVDTAIEVMGAERGFLALLDESSGGLFFSVARNSHRETIDRASFEVSRTVLRQVSDSGEPVLTANAADDAQLGRVTSVALYGLRSVICAPLTTRTRTLGALYLDNRLHEGAFTQDDLDLLSALASQAALAIDNARLFSSLQTAKAYQDSIFASVASGIITLSLGGTIQSFNSAAERILGAAAAEAVGRPYTEVLAPAIVSRLFRPMLALAADETTDDHSQLQVTFDAPARGECTLDVRLSPLRDGDGRSHGLVMSLDDLTEQRRLERARREAEESHRRVRQVFGQFLAPALVDRFVSDPARLMLPGERQEVTILFADLRGYTTISEQLSPEEVVSLLNEYLTLAVEEIQASGGYLDKFIGDAVMAVYNAPEPLSDHAWRAVTTALRIQERLAGLRQSVGVELRAGIGVNTGYAVVGTIGPAQAVNFTVIGDAVNVAARLQAAAAGGQVLISESTYALVRNLVDVASLGPLAVKGRVEPVTPFLVRDLTLQHPESSQLLGSSSHTD